MYIQISYTEPGNQTPHPQAAVVIANVRLQLVPPAAEYELALYHDGATLAAGGMPFESRMPVPFTVSEIGQLQAAFASAVAGLLLQRREFAGGVVVTP